MLRIRVSLDGLFEQLWVPTEFSGNGLPTVLDDDDDNDDAEDDEYDSALRQGTAPSTNWTTKANCSQCHKLRCVHHSVLAGCVSIHPFTSDCVRGRSPRPSCNTKLQMCNHARYPTIARDGLLQY